MTDTKNNTSPFSDVATPAQAALPPNANNDQYATAENTTLTITSATGVLSNDTDPNGLPLNAVLDTRPADGQLTLNADGSFSYVPNLDFFGSDSFTYSANDGLGQSTPATVTITVTPVNQPPIANPVVVSTTENTPLSFPATNLLTNDTPGPPDESGQTLTVTAVGNAVDGTVALSGSTVTFTPAPGFTGAADFTYTIEDNGTTGGQPDPLTATATVTVNVTPPVSVATSTTVVGVPNPSVFGQPVSFTATVTPASSANGPPTGTVQFEINGTDFGPPVPLSNGVATEAITANSVAVGTGTGIGTATSGSIATLAAGSYTVTALYSGDSLHIASTGTVTQVVQPDETTISLTATEATIVSGQPDDFDLSLSVDPPGDPIVPMTGTITVYDNYDGTTTAVVTLTLGQPGTSPAFTAVGTHVLTAVYSGDADDDPSTSAPLTVVVTPAPES